MFPIVKPKTLVPAAEFFFAFTPQVRPLGAITEFGRGPGGSFLVEWLDADILYSERAPLASAGTLARHLVDHAWVRIALDGGWSDVRVKALMVDGGRETRDCAGRPMSICLAGRCLCGVGLDALPPVVRGAIFVVRLGRIVR